MRQNVASILGASDFDGDVAFVDVSNDSVFVDYESRAIAIAAIFVKDAIVFQHRMLDIAQQREGDADLFGEFGIGKRAVNTDPKNLCVGSFEFGDISLIRLHFFRSTTGERENIKGKHHILFAFEITELVAHAPVIRADYSAG